MVSVRLSVRRRFRVLIDVVEPARTVGFGKPDSARTVGFGKRDSENGIRKTGPGIRKNGRPGRAGRGRGQGRAGRAGAK
jgi:hypothetical protein